MRHASPRLSVFADRPANLPFWAVNAIDTRRIAKAFCLVHAALATHETRLARRRERIAESATPKLDDLGTERDLARFPLCARVLKAIRSLHVPNAHKVVASGVLATQTFWTSGCVTRYFRRRARGTVRRVDAHPAGLANSCRTRHGAPIVEANKTRLTGVTCSGRVVVAGLTFVNRAMFDATQNASFAPDASARPSAKTIFIARAVSRYAREVASCPINRAPLPKFALVIPKTFVACWKASIVRLPEIGEPFSSDVAPSRCRRRLLLRIDGKWRRD